PNLTPADPSVGSPASPASSSTPSHSGPGSGVSGSSGYVHCTAVRPGDRLSPVALPDVTLEVAAILGI
ncbi:MAG: hypothetical protein ACYDGY_11000, partial [Acidimicrobiales bacterium]